MASEPACPACEGPLRSWRPATASDPQLAGRSGYELARCPRCGTAVTVDAPSPEAAAALYEGGIYAPPVAAADRALEPLRRLADADRMRFLRGLGPGARVLELGAGDGRFVARMRAAGLDAVGSEPSASARRQAARRGVELAEAPPERDEDAVVIWHALEHFPDPVAALDRAAERLRPGGRLLVAVPNLDSLQAGIGGDRWFHQDVPRHRTHFTARGLRALLERRGFGSPRLHHLLLEQNPLGMWQTLLNRLTGERDVALRLLKRDLRFSDRAAAWRDLGLTALAGVPLALAAPLLELGAGLAGRGGTIVAVAAAEA